MARNEQRREGNNNRRQGNRGNRGNISQNNNRNQRNINHRNIENDEEAAPIVYFKNKETCKEMKITVPTGVDTYEKKYIPIYNGETSKESFYR